MSGSRLRFGAGVVLVAGTYTGFAFIPVGPRVSPDLGLTIACALVLALGVVFLARRLTLDARTQFAVWFSVMFLNLAAVAVEGTLFAPAAAPQSWLGVNLVRLAACSAVMAGAVAVLFASHGNIDEAIRSRPLYGWIWRLAAGAAVYLFLYLFLGGLNYTFVTHPYYEAHAGSLTVPPAGTVFLYEPLRGLLIGLSVLPLTLALRLRTSVVAVIAGLMLFVVGGLVPTLPVASLPLYLRIASLWEIFGQNFLAGFACAYLFTGAGQAAYARPPDGLLRSRPNVPR